MAGRKNGLGRGLDAFFPDRTSAVKESTRKTTTKTVKAEKKTGETEKEAGNTVAAKRKTAGSKSGAMFVKISSVEPNINQPRKQFDEDALLELSESIKQYGILQPLLVSDKKDYYEIIAGERRWRAAKLAGLKEVPVIVKEFTDQELVEISLIENIQREDLNPVEEAMAYKRLIDEFHLKQDEVAERVGKSRTAVTNSMRLLKLSEKVQQMLIDEMITAGHARAILAISDKEKQETVAMKVFDEKLSVRETEALVKRMLEPPKTEKKSKFTTAEDAIYESLEEKMKSIMGTRVQIHRKKNDKGKIEIEYYSKDELERIIDLFESIG
ncbi:MAG: ParB/RepB/Spo0J family partition protein [Blautia sp.]|uniref:ParB/RepB/Spo0J family partition protein n=1 Tax=unclassified Blautia TaxID=2648079 RepID=UPI0025C4C97D|nr:ParB/RepB/Spo0J family partition protein [Blautia sp.]MCI6304236.1 ParB/RepB/Spo0J family partition protein [Blautia sp.]MCI7448261.1 ParB/RepB/Spo0J family partition protein [Blautia sp.]MDD6412535.1 ParB/RepB/Spo0J family partition protein [Blautia sp.]MDY4115851.1 ParB/RepB/Spo0J family partition protein [Blautia sp.]